MGHPDLESVRRRYGQQPTVMLVADALITDEDDRILLVKPTYKPGWLRPGGVVEHAEPPHIGVEREFLEEAGMRQEAGALLVLEWCQMFDQD